MYLFIFFLVIYFPSSFICEGIILVWGKDKFFQSFLSCALPDTWQCYEPKVSINHNLILKIIWLHWTLQTHKKSEVKSQIPSNDFHSNKSFSQISLHFLTIARWLRFVLILSYVECASFGCMGECTLDFSSLLSLAFCLLFPEATWPQVSLVILRRSGWTWILAAQVCLISWVPTCTHSQPQKSFYSYQLISVHKNNFKYVI